nr:hypothetical protein [Bacteroidota bacterium]
MKLYLLLLSGILASTVSSQNFNQGEIRENSSNSCGIAVLDYLGSNYFDCKMVDYNAYDFEITLSEMLRLSKMLNPDAQAVYLTDGDFSNIPMPCILHLSTNHYIVLLARKDGLFNIYDPAAAHI